MAGFPQLGLPAGLLGATEPSRYVGATTGTPAGPATGTFRVGDWVHDTTAGVVRLLVCTTAGTPGVWTVAADSSSGAGTFTGDVTARNALASQTKIGAVGPGGEAGIIFGNPGDAALYRKSATEILVSSGVSITGTGGLYAGTASSTVPAVNNSYMAVQWGGTVNEGLIINAPTGQTADLLDLKVNGARAWGLRNGAQAGGADAGGSLYFGTGAPNNANGANGDIYLRVDGGALSTIYQKRVGAWVGIV